MISVNPPTAWRMLEEGTLDVSSIVTHRMSLDDVIRAYEVFDKRLEGAIKILLDVGPANRSEVRENGQREREKE